MSGMHSDNYELARSSAPQSIKDYSAFTDKQWNYKTDSNGGVYQLKMQVLNLTSHPSIKVMDTPM
jgi:hypothetical protein